MTPVELIAKQQIEIEELKIEVAEYVESHKNIHMIIYCIGGPLNDNKLMYSHKQMSPFFEISNELIDF